MKVRADYNATLEDQIRVDVAEAKRGINELKLSLVGLKTSVDNIGKANGLNNFNKQVKQATGIGKNFKSILGFGTVVAGARKAWSLLKEMTNESIDFVETTNLFNVSMGKGLNGLNQYYEKAVKFQNDLQEKLGVNIAESMNYQALFNSMSKSMGISAKYAYTLSENFTKLGYDLASLYNINPENVMQKLRAGLAGQTKPLRDLGLDITQQSLQPIVDSLGIDRSIKNMSQAEKMILRYIAVLNQAKIAQGDFANTMDSPANQLRIFNAQVVAFKRNMGNLWQGFLGGILPYVNAIMMVINELLKMVAKLFGFEVSEQKVNISANIGADDLASDLGTAGKKAKELKAQLMGFDEINNISLQDSSGSGGSSGGATGGGIDQRLLDAMKEYDNLMDKVKNKATEIRDRIMRWLGFTQELNSETGKLEWKLRKDIYPNILKIRDGAIAVGTALLGWKVAKIAKNILELVGNFGSAEKAGSGFLGLVSNLSTKLGIGTGSLVGTISIVGIGLIALTGYLVKTYHESDNFRQGIKTIKDTLINLSEYIYSGIKGALSDLGEWLNNLIPKPIKQIVENLNKGLNELQITSNDLILSIIPCVGTFGKLTIALKALGYINKPIIEEFTVLNDEMIESGNISQDTADKLNPMISGFENIQRKLRTLDYSKMSPSKQDVDSIKNNMKTIVQTVGTEIETNKQNAINSISELFANSGISNKEKQQMIKSVEEMYMEQNKKMKEMENQTTQILEKAQKERRPLREDEVRIVAENQAKMSEITIKEMSETEQEFKNIQARITATATEHSVLQASEIIKQAVKTREDTKTEAELRYQEQVAIANQLRERGTEESVKMADKIIEEAERQKEETNKTADESFSKLITTYQEKNPEILKLVDKNTGEIKSRWDIMKEDVSKKWTEMWENIKKTAEDMWNGIVTFFTQSIPKWWNENISPWFTKEKWEGIANDAKSGIESKFNEWKEKFKPIEDWWKNKIAPWFTWEKWQQLGKDAIQAVQSAFSNFNFKIKMPHFKWESGGIQAPNWAKGILEALNLPTTLPKLNVEWYANGGLPTKGELFVAREAGPELVGRMGSHNAVANNGQIIDGIKQGVYEAVISAMSQQKTGTSRVEIIADKDGIFKVVQTGAEEYAMQTGESPFPVMA